jgi:hypothetical protein
LGDEPTGRNIYAQTVEMLAFRQIWDGFAYVYNNAKEVPERQIRSSCVFGTTTPDPRGWAFHGWRTRARTSSHSHD